MSMCTVARSDWVKSKIIFTKKKQKLLHFGFSSCQCRFRQNSLHSEAYLSYVEFMELFDENFFGLICISNSNDGNVSFIPAVRK